MPGKNKYWHKDWSWHGQCVAVHTCGLLVCMHPATPALYAQAAASVLPAVQHEARRGVPMEEMPARITALRAEGRRWLQDKRNHRAAQLVRAD